MVRSSAVSSLSGNCVCTETLSEAGFANDQAPVVILNGAGNDFGSRGALPVHQHDQRNFNALVSAHGIIAALRRRPSMMRNHDLIFFEKHIRHAHGLIQQSAAVVAQIDDQAIEL